MQQYTFENPLLITKEKNVKPSKHSIFSLKLKKDLKISMLAVSSFSKPKLITTSCIPFYISVNVDGSLTYKMIFSYNESRNENPVFMKSEPTLKEIIPHYSNTPMVINRRYLKDFRIHTKAILQKAVANLG